MLFFTFLLCVIHGIELLFPRKIIFPRRFLHFVGTSSSSLSCICSFPFSSCLASPFLTLSFKSHLAVSLGCSFRLGIHRAPHHRGRHTCVYFHSHPGSSSIGSLLSCHCCSSPGGCFLAKTSPFGTVSGFKSAIAMKFGNQKDCKE